MSKRGATFQGGKDVGLNDPNMHSDSSNPARKLNAAQLARRKIAEPRRRSRQNSPSFTTPTNNHTDGVPTFASSFATSTSETPAPSLSLAFGGTANANTGFNFSFGAGGAASPFSSNPFAGQAAKQAEEEQQRLLERRRQEEEYYRNNPEPEHAEIFSPGLPQAEIEKKEREGWTMKVVGHHGVWVRKSDGKTEAEVRAAEAANGAGAAAGGDAMETSPDAGAKVATPPSAPVTKILFGAPGGNAPSLFGAPVPAQQQQQQQQQQQPAAFGFGNTSVFGSSTANKPIESHSFSGTTNTNPLGGAAQQQSQPALGAGIGGTSSSFTFGSTSTTNTPSFFGASTSAQGPTPSTSTSFSAGTGTGTGTSLFGSGSDTSKSIFSSFGQGAQTQNQQSPAQPASTPAPTFGTNTSTSMFGSGSFGQSQTQQTQEQEKPALPAPTSAPAPAPQSALFGSVDPSKSIFGSFAPKPPTPSSTTTSDKPTEEQPAAPISTIMFGAPAKATDEPKTSFFGAGAGAAKPAFGTPAFGASSFGGGAGAAPSMFGASTSASASTFSKEPEKEKEAAATAPAPAKPLFGASVSTTTTPAKPLFGAPAPAKEAEEKDTGAVGGAKSMFGSPSAFGASSAPAAAAAAVPAKSLFGASVTAPAPAPVAAKEAEKEKEKEKGKEKEEPLFVPMSDEKEKGKEKEKENEVGAPKSGNVFGGGAGFGGAATGAGLGGAAATGAGFGEKKGGEKEKESQGATMGAPEDRPKATTKKSGNMPYKPRNFGPSIALEQIQGNASEFDKRWRLRALNEVLQKKIAACDITTQDVDTILEFYLRTRLSIGCPLGYALKMSKKRKHTSEHRDECAEPQERRTSDDSRKKAKSVNFQELPHEKTPSSTPSPMDTEPSNTSITAPPPPPSNGGSNTASLFASSFHSTPTSHQTGSPAPSQPQPLLPIESSGNKSYKSGTTSSPDSGADDDSNYKSMGTTSPSPDPEPEVQSPKKRSLFERAEINRTQGSDDEQKDDDEAPAKRSKSSPEPDGSTTPQKPVPANPFSAAGAGFGLGSSKPASFLNAGTKPDEPAKPSGSLFQGLNTSAFGSTSANPPFGSLFGKPASTPSIFTAAGAAGTAGGAAESLKTPESSKPASPAGEADQDEDKTDDPQLDLLRPKPADDEEVAYELRSQLLKLVSGEGWKTQGIGLARVMKNRKSKKAYLVHRLDPTGRVLLNAALSPKLKYTARDRGVMFSVPVEGASPENYMLRAGKGGENDAKEMAKIMEESKMGE